MTRILVPLFGQRDVDSIALNTASDLAKINGAQIDVRLFHRDPKDVVPLIGEGVTPAAIEALQQATKSQLKEQSVAAKSDFQNWHSGLKAKNAKGAKIAANFGVITGRPLSEIIAPARVADITIVCAGDGD